MTDVEQRWSELTPREQADLFERLQVQPVRLVRRWWWVRLVYAPKLWWKHYGISRRYMGRWHSARWAMTWTLLLLFPGFKLRNANHEGR